MVVSDLCPQAFIFLCFSLTQVTIDTVKGEYNKALFKFWIMIIFTLLLNNLCMRGLGIISWTIIFMPFMLMSIITAILLYVFGLDPTTGKLKYYTPDGEDTISVNSNRMPVTTRLGDISLLVCLVLTEWCACIPQDGALLFHKKGPKMAEKC